MHSDYRSSIFCGKYTESIEYIVEVENNILVKDIWGSDKTYKNDSKLNKLYVVYNYILFI